MKAGLPSRSVSAEALNDIGLGLRHNLDIGNNNQKD